MPTKFSGDINLTNGKSLSNANFAAKAVLPLPYFPSNKSVSNYVFSEFFIWFIKSLEILYRFLKFDP